MGQVNEVDLVVDKLIELVKAVFRITQNTPNQ
jgi:hypothetical protein